MNSDSEGTPSYGAEEAELSPVNQNKSLDTSLYTTKFAYSTHEETAYG